ncbi:MAG: quinolinate synthase NadA [Thermofilaceae archaeon]
MTAIEKVRKLLEGRDAVLLAHNYQRPEVQDAADYVGDSLELTLKALESKASIVVFAGVDFMAEQAAVLCPNKTVLTPEPTAKCPMAAMLTPELVKKYRKRYPRAPFIVYVNTLARVKALADYVVTSANAVKLISSLDSEIILFGPDKNLAGYVAEVTGKNIVPVPKYGHCPVHEIITLECLLANKSEHPNAKILVHPECPREARRLADFIGSTGQMVKAVSELGGREYVVATEVGLLHRMRKTGIAAYSASPYAVCVEMKKTTLGKVTASLLEGKSIVRVQPKVAERVRGALERSFEILGVDIPWLKR